MSYGCILIIIIIIGILFRLIKTSEDEHRLIHYLFSQQDYNPLIRPTQYSNETVVVSFGLLLVQLIHVYEKEQVMKTNTWLHMKWYDPQLRWNPQRYGGIDKINIPYSYVWTPDVVLFNNADGNYEVSFKCKVVLMHTGVVHWVPPAIYKSSCRIDVKYFPFDTQECEMRFASWTYNAREVMFSYYTEEKEQRSDITKLLPQQVYSASSDELYKDDYLESGTWDVIGIPSKFVHYRSNISNVLPDYIEIVFLIQMRRKALYYTVNLIVPTGLMSILICIVFCLPTAAGEKMTLCMSVLLALNLFQLLVTKILPPTSAVVPLIAKYLLFTFSLNVLVIINTVIITNFYYRTPTTHTMPAWVRQVFLQILPRFLWLDSSRFSEKQIEYELSSSINTIDQSVILGNPYHMLTETTADNRRIKSKLIDRHYRMSDVPFIPRIKSKRRATTTLSKSISRSKYSHHQKQKQSFLVTDEGNHLIPLDSHHNHHHRLQVAKMRREMIQAISHIRFIASHCARRAFIESIRDEWKFIAIVIDRLQFIIFSTITIIGTFTLLFQAPNLFHIEEVDQQKLARFSNPNLTINELILTTRT
ncbi:unnamed protein product [Adineta steineri]|uniref:Uncharacterized protein n=1 Tax=Adineta steineri TaxID=433720 RepID=A0A819FJB9_9BILA|nr:unnamed protein product [Adineta steineri]